MKPSQLIQFLSSAIQARLPILITGAPGVGKTSITEQVAHLTDSDFVVSHPVVEDPTDAKGLPWPDKAGKTANFLPFGETARVLNAKKQTIWMIDDLGQATPAVQASYMQWILARRVNSHVLPDHVSIIAATNRRTDRAGVQGLLEPVKSRFASIVSLETDLDDWCEWACEEDPKTGESRMPPELIAFLRFRQDYLHQFNPTQDLTNSPCPRTWANAGSLIRLNLPNEVEYHAYAGAVGEPAAAELTGFLRIYRQMPSLEAILADPDKAAIPSDPAVLYAISVGLAAKSNPNNFGRVTKYAQRLYDGGHGEHGVC